jgi:hypothetical protein
VVKRAEWTQLSDFVLSMRHKLVTKPDVSEAIITGFVCGPGIFACGTPIAFCQVGKYSQMRSNHFNISRRSVAENCVSQIFGDATVGGLIRQHGRADIYRVSEFHGPTFMEEVKHVTPLPTYLCVAFDLPVRRS